jgi:Fe-S oxidoreductase
MERVQLFATCLGDLFFPAAVADAEQLLVAAGLEVEFPATQVCCGQPAFNSGHHRAARRVARTFPKAFRRDAPIVCPSGSCATMASHYLPQLLDVKPFDVWELSAFLEARGGGGSTSSQERRRRTRSSPPTRAASCISAAAPSTSAGR